MKDDFVSTVSHEFKTPLTTIMGFLTVMLEGETGKLSEQQAKFLNIAKAAAKRLAGLVADLLTFPGSKAGSRWIFSLRLRAPAPGERGQPPSRRRGGGARRSPASWANCRPSCATSAG